jgi:dihydrodiol dehydrogenase / D-xylose 1-dehydrogenase (NADP)
MKEKIRWGILGAGSIAHKFAAGLQVLPDAVLAAVGSRSRDKAAEFAAQYDIPYTYGSYEDLAASSEVDVIYIATPHSLHRENSILCLNAGKAVLCEKPFTVSAAEAAEVIACAHRNKVFLMEAMWSRFMPVMQEIRERIFQGAIGDVRMVTADFGFRFPWDAKSRLLDPALAGGALLDVGIYTLSFASMIYGKAPVQVTSMAHLGKTGVDEQSAFLLGYERGKMAVLSCAIQTNTPQEARILGTDGSIHIPCFWHAASATLTTADGKVEQIAPPVLGNGYNYEAAEVIRCLREGKLESDRMPLAETLEIMKTMDAIRAQWGLQYPME